MEPDNPIKEYTTLPGLHRVFHVETSSLGRGKIYLEGHDISHLVRSYSIMSNVNEAVTVTLELVALDIR
jgi:hypothetical protein